MSDYSTNASVNLTINGQQAEQTLVNLKQAALNLTNEIAKAAAAGDKVTLKKLRRELNDTNRKIKEIESATMQVDAVMRRLDKATPRDLQKSLATLNKQLDYMERGSNAWNEQVKKIKLVKNEISKVNAELGKSQTMLERFNNTWQRWQTVAVGGVAALTGAVMAGKQAVQMYAEMDQEMASVRKYTGLTAEQVEHLNEEFKKIDTRSSREQLNQLAQEAGRLGKTSEKDVLGFVRAADQINVALDDLGEGATLQLSKLTNIFGDEDADTIELKIVPAWIDDTTPEKGQVIFLPLGDYGTDIKNQELTPDEAFAQMRTNGDYYINNMTQQESTEFLDKLFVAFSEGIRGPLKYPRPTIDTIEVMSDGGYFSKPHSLSLQFAYFKDSHYARKIDPIHKYSFKFLSDDIPNVRALFYIKGKQFICEKITATFNEHGMSQLLKGDFYEVVG